MSGSRIRHTGWGPVIIWGKRENWRKVPSGAKDAWEPTGSEARASLRHSDRKRRKGLLWGAPLGGPGFKTKTNLGEWEGRQERNKQTNRALQRMLSPPTIQPWAMLPGAPVLTWSVNPPLQRRVALYLVTALPCHGCLARLKAWGPFAFLLSTYTSCNACVT